MNVKVLVISGAMGTGKTTVLGEVSDVLAARAIPHAAIDLDAVAAVLLPEEALRAAMSNPELVMCRLLAPPETMEHRIRLREPGMHQEAFVARSRSLDAILSAAKVEDFTTLNAGGDISGVALDVLQRAGWVP